MDEQALDQQLSKIAELMEGHSAGLSVAQVHALVGPAVTRRTLQRRLAQWVQQGRLVAVGRARGTVYALAALEPRAGPGPTPAYRAIVPLSTASLAIAAYVRQPLALRRPVAYRLELLESYQPGHTYYLDASLRRSLHDLGRSNTTTTAAGTFAKEILNRLLIDLSWASSHLEGNTYTRLDTERLIAYGETAVGKNALETQMILNHKVAIEYLVDRADSIDLGPRTLLDLHALLSDGLLADPAASGRLRRRAVGIGGSVYLPMALPQRVAQVFELLTETANAIVDPFEQALFVMVQLPYLQPFEDVNKRVSRLAANVPLIRHNLVPLAFLDVPEQAYTDAILGVYERGQIDLLRDVFIWAYERSCQTYAALQQQLVPPEPLRLKYRRQLSMAVCSCVEGGEPDPTLAVQKSVPQSVQPEDRGRFVKMVQAELQGLHEGNAVRFGLSALAVRSWRATDSRRSTN